MTSHFLIVLLSKKCYIFLRGSKKCYLIVCFSDICMWFLYKAYMLHERISEEELYNEDKFDI